MGLKSNGRPHRVCSPAKNIEVPPFLFVTMFIRIFTGLRDLCDPGPWMLENELMGGIMQPTTTFEQVRATILVAALAVYGPRCKTRARCLMGQTYMVLDNPLCSTGWFPLHLCKRLPDGTLKHSGSRQTCGSSHDPGLASKASFLRFRTRPHPSSPEKVGKL